MAGCDNSATSGAPKAEALATLVAAQPSALRPDGELAEMFLLGSNNTDIQRENKLKEITGQVVQWQLPVFEVSRHGDGYKVQTSQSSEGLLGQALVGTFIYLTPRDDKERQTIEALKTGSLITIKAIISGSSFRSLELTPAIIVTQGSPQQAGVATATTSTSGNLDVGIAAFGKNDYATALNEFRPLADQGNAIAQNHLGVMYVNGQGVPQDYTEAAKWFRKAADQSYAKAQTNLGSMYFNGKGVSQDNAEAVKWLRKAADQGYADAQTTLGLMYLNGKGVTQDNLEAMKWIRKAADQGNADGQVKLGSMYDKGRGVPQDNAEAMNWYRKAADQGNADGQVKLGVMYATGQGVPQDNAMAVQLFRKAADQGNARGQYNVGLSYAKGQGVTEDVREAVTWFRKAADQGDVTAQNILGVIYENGEGMQQDKAEAVKWYTLAAQQGSVEAINRLKVLQSQQTAPADDDKLLTVRGGKLSISGGLNDMTLLFNGQKLRSSDGFSLSIEKKYTIGDTDIALIMNNSGGTACPVQYFFVSVTVQGTTKLSPEFGTCSDLAKPSQTGPQIVVVMPKMNGRGNENYVFENGTLTDNGKLVK